MKAVGNMLFHLTEMSSIWRNVLPTKAYCRSIGTLLNSALKDIIQSVTSIEEFSFKDCIHLQDILSSVIDASYDLFRGLGDGESSVEVAVQQYVASWMQFKELLLFLGLSLCEVADRWADGKGPLAMYFTAQQVMRLVLAMFENTRKREALLVQLRRKPSVHLL